LANSLLKLENPKLKHFAIPFELASSQFHIVVLRLESTGIREPLVTVAVFVKGTPGCFGA